MKVPLKKQEVILVTLGSTQSSPRRGDKGSGEPDRSIAPSGSSLLATLSIRCNTWIAPTDKSLVVERQEKKTNGVKEEESGSQRRGCKTRQGRHD